MPEIYTAMPFSIAFTALAWHALLSVPVGRPAALVIAALGAWATLTSFMPVPFAPVLLAALLGLALWCLWRLRPRRRATDFLSDDGPGVALSSTAPLAGIALGASLTNAALAAGGVAAPAVPLAATALSALGVGLLAWSVFTAVRARPA